MKTVTTSDAPEAIGPYSQAMTFNGIVYTSGQIALTPEGEFLDGSVEEQTHQVLKNLTAVLQASGSSLQSVIKTTVFLANMDDFLKINAIYAEYFGVHKPARSTVAVKTLPKNALIEIECIAMTGKNYSY